MVPLLKAIVAHYRDDPVWADVRPPFEAIEEAEAGKVVAELAEKLGLRLEVGETA